LLVAGLQEALRLDEGFDEDGNVVTSMGALSLRDAETIAELSQFVREADGKMHGQPHDDQVMALGIANQMTSFVFHSEWQEPTRDPWSVDGWLDYASERDMKDGFLIGAGNHRK